MNAVAHPLLLQLSETNAHGREISLTVRGYEIRGRIALDGASLDLRGRDGTVSAEQLVIAGVTIAGHGVRIGAQQLTAAHCTIGWGRRGLRVEAASIEIEAVQVIGDDEPFEGTVVLQGVSLADVAVHRGDVRVGRGRIARSEVDAKLPARHEANGDGHQQPAKPSVGARVLEVLDRSSGHFDVDLGLDLAVPVIGRRRATHEFRIPIDAGTIDYRQLESNLSTLEDQLLDFSVRDEGLVLEVGVPLIPTRGLGKPIVTWPLGDADRALAQQQRVRLSVLARPNPNGRGDNDKANGKASDNASDDKPSKFALRKASLGTLGVSFALAPSDDGLLRRLGALAITGNVLLEQSDEANAYAVRGQLDAVQIEDLHVAGEGADSVQADDALAQLREVASDTRV